MIAEICSLRAITDYEDILHHSFDSEEIMLFGAVAAGRLLGLQVAGLLLLDVVFAIICHAPGLALGTPKHGN